MEDPAESLADWFPVLRLIQRSELREVVLLAHLLAMKRGGWTREDVENLPYIDSNAMRPLEISYLAHVCAAAEIVNSASQKLIDLHGYPVDRELAVAGALVHDVGLFLEFRVTADGSVALRDPGAHIRHPALGASLVLEAGGDIRLAHIVANHSYEGDRVKRSVEGLIVHYCDFLEYDLARGAVAGL